MAGKAVNTKALLGLGRGTFRLGRHNVEPPYDMDTTVRPFVGPPSLFHTRLGHATCGQVARRQRKYTSLGLARVVVVTDRSLRRPGQTFTGLFSSIGVGPRLRLTTHPASRRPSLGTERATTKVPPSLGLLLLDTLTDRPRRRVRCLPRCVRRRQAL